LAQEKLVNPGEICVSQLAYNHLRGRAGMDFEPVGPRPRQLKNIANPVRVYRYLQVPPPWYKKQASRWADRLARTEFAAIIFISFLAVAAGTSYYLREPPLLWRTILSEIPVGPTIAVLPFRNLSNDPKQDYLSAGLTEDITTELQRADGAGDLRVLASTATLPYKNKVVDSSTLGAKLGAHYVLAGSVRSNNGDNLHVTAQLSDTQTGKLLWSKTFDTKVKLRDGIVAAIVGKIGSGYGIVQTAEAKSATQEANLFSSNRLGAYELVLRAHQRLKNEWDEQAFREAYKLLKDALSIDDKNGPARRELAYIKVMGWVFGYWDLDKDLHQTWDEVRKEALQVAETYNDNARAYMVAAVAWFFDQGLGRDERLKLFNSEAAEALKRSDDPEIKATLGAMIANTGQWKKGLKLVTEAHNQNEDASRGWYETTLYLNDFMHGDYTDAVAKIQENPDFKDKVSYAVMDYMAICGQMSLSGSTCTLPPIDKAWDEIDEAPAKDFEDWYRLWNFNDEDFKRIMDGVHESLRVAESSKKLSQQTKTAPTAAQ